MVLGKKIQSYMATLPMLPGLRSLTAFHFASACIGKVSGSRWQLFVFIYWAKQSVWIICSLSIVSTNIHVPLTTCPVNFSRENLPLPSQ